MRIFDEATAMLEQGERLIVREIWDGERRVAIEPVTLCLRRTASDSSYELVDPVEGSAQFPHSLPALRELVRRVGQRGLSATLSARRYEWLFPDGSSLEWRRAGALQKVA